MSLQQSIAHYKIVSKLGEGGMGTVYRATDTKLNRDVAIKMLPAAFAADATRMARFEREAQVLAALNHPNIAAIYGVEQNAIVMELVPGEELKGPVPIDRAMAYAKQLAAALEAAHEKGIVHRDLKPANIKITPDGTLKVLDFGLAKANEEGAVASSSSPTMSPTVSLSMTQQGVILGTAAYMSPEQARGKPVDKRADIWAFGVVLFEMLTGTVLFGGGETVSDSMVAVITREPDWNALPKGTPAHVRKLLARCLKKDPRQRMRDIGEARIALDEPEPPAAAPAAASIRRAWLPWVIAGVALGAASLMAWRNARSAGGDRPLIRVEADLGADALAPWYSSSPAAIAPDGGRIVYPVRVAGRQMLASRLLDKPNPTVIAGTEDGADPFFSPDSRSIGFFADGRLKRVALEGGAPVILAEASNPRGAGWGEDGSIIAALTNNQGLWRIPASGGAPQPFTKLVGEEVTHRWPQVLAGGQTVLFTASRNTSHYEDATIEAADLKTGARRVVRPNAYFGRYFGGHLLYVHDGTLIALPVDGFSLRARGDSFNVIADLANSPTSGTGQFSASQTGIMVYQSGKPQAEAWSIAALDANGASAPQPQLAKPGAYFTPRYSPDGRRLALAMETNGVDTYSYDFASDVLTRLTFSGGLAYHPVWMPDGKHIVVQSSDRGNHAFLWVRADGAGGARTLLQSKDGIQPESVSPDGRYLAYQQFTHSNFDSWIVPLDLSDPEHPKAGEPQAFAQTAANEIQPAFSPDGRFVAYASDESGGYEVYVRPFPSPAGSGKWQISLAGGRMPVWSSDRKSLLFQNTDNRIMVASYTVNGASFTASNPRLWMDGYLLNPTSLTDRNFDLSPDGKHIEVILPPNAEEQKLARRVVFLFNFFDELKRRAAGK
jgi:serine/threonine-protein kinase